MSFNNFLSILISFDIFFPHFVLFLKFEVERQLKTIFKIRYQVSFHCSDGIFVHFYVTSLSGQNFVRHQYLSDNPVSLKIENIRKYLIRNQQSMLQFKKKIKGNVVCLGFLSNSANAHWTSTRTFLFILICYF